MNMYIRTGVDERRRERNTAACRDHIWGVPFALARQRRERREKDSVMRT